MFHLEHKSTLMKLLLINHDDLSSDGGDIVS